MCLQVSRQIESMLSEEVKTMGLFDQHSSIILNNFIYKNNILYIAAEFNRIGLISQNATLASVQDAILPCFIKPSILDRQPQQLVLYEQLQLCLNLEVTLFHRLLQPNEDLGHIRTQNLEITKEWIKSTIGNINRLTCSLKKSQSNSVKENWKALHERINQHLKVLIGKIMLAETLSLVLTSECRPQLCRNLYLLMRYGVQLMNCIDSSYEEHFIVLI